MASARTCQSLGLSQRSRLAWHGAAHETEMAGVSPVIRLLVAVVASLFLAQTLDRHDTLVLGSVEHDHALGRASGDADACDTGVRISLPASVTSIT